MEERYRTATRQDEMIFDKGLALLYGTLASQSDHGEL